MCKCVYKKIEIWYSTWRWKMCFLSILSKKKFFFWGGEGGWNIESKSIKENRLQLYIYNNIIDFAEMIRKQNSIFKNFGMNFYKIQVVYLGLLILYNTYMVICILLYIYVMQTTCKRTHKQHYNMQANRYRIIILYL